MKLREDEVVLKRQCNAIATSTGNPCKRRALPGSRYCYFHVEKVPLMIGALVGALLSVVVTEIWRAFVPSVEFRQLASVESKLEPFVQLAKARFPQLETEAALEQLRREIEDVRELAEPPKILVDKHDIQPLNDGYLVLVYLKSSKDQPLGTVRFTASTLQDTTARILEFKPALMTMNLRQSISRDGKRADIQFSIPGSEEPILKIHLSDGTALQIEGSHNLRPFTITVP